MSIRLPAFLICALLLAACEPGLGNPPSLLTSTRVLAIRGTPPEAAPGAMVQFDLLVASPAGTVASPPADWAFCVSATPPSDNNIVGNACLEASGVATIGGPEAVAVGTIPMNACELFGPNVPSPPMGQPPQAPVSPDITGGYYQPVRVELSGLAVDGQAAFAQERISCGLADASADTALALTKAYTANRNPVLQSIAGAASGGSPATVFQSGETAAEWTVNRGAQVTFTGSWPASSAETFPVYDSTTFTLSTQRESLRLSWFASGGVFADDVTGVASTDMATTTSNVWTAPATGGTVHFWAVLRDDRGGTDFGSFDVAVQ